MKGGLRDRPSLLWYNNCRIQSSKFKMQNYSLKFKIFLILLTLHFALLTSPTLVFGHGAGLPPFFRVNNQLSPPNPLQSIGVTPLNLNVAQDLSPDKYLVNTPVNFEIDATLLSQAIPSDILQKVNFSWDFGDGQTGSGVKNTHTYSKVGSTILAITAQYGDPSIPSQIIESVQLNIVPTADYKLPQAVIEVNDKQSADPTKGTMDFDLNNKLKFNASKSSAPSSKIVEYFWDFGDGKTSNQASLDHRYKLPQYYITPVLHIKDANGLTSDAFVNLKNSGKNDPNDPEAEDQRSLLLLVSGIIAGCLVILAVGYLLVRKFTRGKHINE